MSNPGVILSFLGLRTFPWGFRGHGPSDYFFCFTLAGVFLAILNSRSDKENKEH